MRLVRGVKGAFTFCKAAELGWRESGSQVDAHTVLCTEIQVPRDAGNSQLKPRTWKLTVIIRAEAIVTAKDW